MRKKLFGPDIFLLILALLSLAPAAAEAACVNPPSGLVSWWGGDNNALDIVGTNNGTLVGRAAYGSGMAGQAFSFDGSENGYVEMPNTSSLNPGGAFSVGGWFYIDPAASGNAGEIATLVAKTEGSTNNGWALYFDDRWSTKSLKFVLGSVLELQNAIPTAGWYHIVGVFDPSLSPNSRLFINGEMAAYTDCGGATANGLNARIGAMYWTDSYHQGNDRLNGKADEVVYFNRALSSSEISAIYNAGSEGMCRPCAVAPSGLVSWWKGENNANDAFGTNNGSLHGGTAYNPGKVGQAFSFDGINDYVSIPYSSNLDLKSDFSIEAWVNPHGFGPATTLVAGKAGGYQLFIESDGRVTIGFYNGVTPWILLSSVSGLPVDSWSHLVGTLDSTKGIMTVYINSQPDNGLSTLWTPVANSNNLEIGGFSCCGNFFSGLIDEVSVFNRALTGDEIAAIYNAGSSGMALIDTTPDAFSFTAQTGMPLNTIIVSNPITVSGINYATPISIAGGEYQVNAGLWTSLVGTVNNGDAVKVRQTSSSSNSTLTTATLTTGGVSADFNVTTAAANDPNASGLVAWWRGENNAYDSVGGHNGTLLGGTAYATGKNGKAFNFDGVDAYVSVPSDSALNITNGDFTVDAWIYLNAIGPYGEGIIGRLSSDNSSGWGLAIQGNTYGDQGKINFFSNGDWSGQSSCTVSVNSWTHVAVTRAGTALSYYMNGIPSGLFTNTGSLDNSLPLSIGDVYAGNPESFWKFDGLIDEVKIFSRALSADEVTRLAGKYTLTIAKVGSGTVTAIPDGGSTDMLSWNGNTGTADFNSGTQVSLAASAGTAYTFYGWSGAFISNVNPSQITMNASMAITATFDDYTDPGPVCNNPPFKMSSTMHNYPTIKDAYNVLGNTETLEIRSLSFNEGLLDLDQDKSVTVSGGYDCNFAGNSGLTTIQNSMTISGGTVTVEKIELQ